MRFWNTCMFRDVLNSSVLFYGDIMLVSMLVSLNTIASKRCIRLSSNLLGKLQVNIVRTVQIFARICPVVLLQGKKRIIKTYRLKLFENCFCTAKLFKTKQKLFGFMVEFLLGQDMIFMVTCLHSIYSLSKCREIRKNLHILRPMWSNCLKCFSLINRE